MWFVSQVGNLGLVTKCKKYLNNILCGLYNQLITFLILIIIGQILTYRSLPLSIPEAAWGVGGGVYTLNLKFHTWYEVEIYTRDTPGRMMTIRDVICWVT